MVNPELRRQVVNVYKGTVAGQHDMQKASSWVEPLTRRIQSYFFLGESIH